jgi:hypothetical protein
MSRRRYSPIAVATVALSAFFVAGGGSALATTPPDTLGVPISGDTTNNQYGGAGGPHSLTAGTALYVDASGAAHVAYIDQDGWDIDLCTIPAGGTACAPAGTLHTDGTTFGEPISSIKYLPDGNGSAILVATLWNLGTGDQPHPSFDPRAEAPYSETEVFLPGSTTGIGIGDLYDDGGQTGGDEIYVPAENGLDEVGVDESIEQDWDITPANSYQFASFTSPSSADSAPIFLGVHALAPGPGYLPAAEELPGEWPVGVTQLANGLTAVFAEDITPTILNTQSMDDGTNTWPFDSAVGMYVQPAAGGAFAPIQQLGVSGPIETDFASGQDTYLVNVQSGSSCQQESYCTGDAVNEPIQLYDFRGTSLESLGSVGTTQGPYDQQSEWDTLPPSFEDSAGDMYVAWLAGNGADGCPPAPPDNPSSDKLTYFVDGCVIYRRIAPGGLFGPKIVLSYSYTHQGNNNYETYFIGGVDQIATNAAGEGWVLSYRGSLTYTGGNDTLYAQPLVSSAGLSAPPSVSGTSVMVPLTCDGATSGSCGLTVSIDSSASAANSAQVASSKHSHKSKKRPVVLATAKLKLSGGGDKTLVLHLNSAGKRLLKGKHHLTVALQVSQKVGLVSKPTSVYSGKLTLG